MSWRPFYSEKHMEICFLETFGADGLETGKVEEENDEANKSKKVEAGADANTIAKRDAPGPGAEERNEAKPGLLQLLCGTHSHHTEFHGADEHDNYAFHDEHFHATLNGRLENSAADRHRLNAHRNSMLSVGKAQTLLARSAADKKVVPANEAAKNDLAAHSIRWTAARSRIRKLQRGQWVLTEIPDGDNSAQRERLVRRVFNNLATRDRNELLFQQMEAKKREEAENFYKDRNESLGLRETGVGAGQMVFGDQKEHAEVQLVLSMTAFRRLCKQCKIPMQFAQLDLIYVQMTAQHIGKEATMMNWDCFGKTLRYLATVKYKKLVTDPNDEAQAEMVYQKLLGEHILKYGTLAPAVPEAEATKNALKKSRGLDVREPFGLHPALANLLQRKRAPLVVEESEGAAKAWEAGAEQRAKDEHARQLRVAEEAAYNALSDEEKQALKDAEEQSRGIAKIKQLLSCCVFNLPEDDDEQDEKDMIELDVLPDDDAIEQPAGEEKGAEVVNKDFKHIEWHECVDEVISSLTESCSADIEQQEELPIEAGFTNYTAMFAIVLDTYSMCSLAFSDGIPWDMNQTAREVAKAPMVEVPSLGINMFWITAALGATYPLFAISNMNAARKGTLGQGADGLPLKKFTWNYLSLQICAILGGSLYMPILLNLVKILQCTYDADTGVGTLLMDSAVTCWDSYHLLAVATFVFSACLFYPMASFMYPNLQFVDKGLDIKFDSSFLVLTAQAKVKV